MNHPSLEVLQDYFENAVDTKLEARVKAHVEHCDQCTKILADFVVIETRVKSTTQPTISQNTQARIFLEAGELLKKKREYHAMKKDFAELAKDWRENIIPEIRIPALQLASVSLMLATFIAIEKVQSTEEIIFEPLSNDVKVYEGEKKA